jgi:GNAT superfamily N-acetyltransferase
MKQVEIVEFTEKYAADFARLNYEWIEHFFQIEAHDREMLDNPVEYIIKDGGQIFFALSGEKAVGTAALLRVGEESFELAKMAVAPEYRGLKIGDKLMSACLEYAKNVGKRRVFLLSNTKLAPALALYKKFGFREIPLDPDNLYERTDIQMEILL